jgi:hypothetical protein
MTTDYWQQHKQNVPTNPDPFVTLWDARLKSSAADPYPNPDPDPHVFGPPGSESGSISQRYGSGSGSCSGSGSFRHLSNLLRKTLIFTLL